MLRRCRWFGFFGAAVGSLRAFVERSLAGVLVGDPAVPPLDSNGESCGTVHL